MSDIVLVSGGFDPIHVGHLRMFEEAARYGSLFVALNSDAWLMRKKGFVFMPWEDRAEIILGFRCVTWVVPFNDDDGTACDAINRTQPQYFANGGDRNNTNVPEQECCIKNGVEILWNVGGAKARSSSELVAKAKGAGYE